MTRTTTLLMTVVLVIGGVSAFPLTMAAPTDSSASATVAGSVQAQANENASATATNVTPGERLSGVIGVGQAEFEGEIEQRAYGLEFARAATANAKADVVADRLDRIEQRLDELEEQKQELDEARENGEMGDGQYNARAAELAARTETVKQLTDASEARANSLPADLLEEKGINVTAIQALKTNAENLTGPEVAAIAQSIAGDRVGQSVSQGPPSAVGVSGPDQVGDRDGGADEARAAIDRADEQLNATETRLEEVEARVGENASENATAALEQAREELDRARQALEDARRALDVGNQEQALKHAEDALNHAEQAEEHAQATLEEARSAGQDGDTETTQGDDQDDGSDSGDGRNGG